MTQIHIIVARGNNHVIGGNNELLWHLPADLKFFKEKTMGNVMLMGRKTYESIGRPLPGRTTWVLSSNKDLKIEGVTVFNTKEAVLSEANKLSIENLYVVGGGEIYNLFLPLVHTIHVTEVDTAPEGDTFFDFPINDFTLVASTDYEQDEKNKFDFSFDTYIRK